MKDFLMRIHYKIVDVMAESWVVENILIAKVREDGELHDCIYCTVLRNAVLFLCIGITFGYVLATFI